MNGTLSTYTLHAGTSVACFRVVASSTVASVLAKITIGLGYRSLSSSSPSIKTDALQRGLCQFCRTHVNKQSKQVVCLHFAQNLGKFCINHRECSAKNRDVLRICPRAILPRHKAPEDQQVLRRNCHEFLRVSRMQQ